MYSRATLVLFLVTAAFAAPPCTSARPECTEWIVYAGGPARSLIYRTHSLDVRNPQVTRALIVVHGMGRDADNYFRSAVAAAFLAGALENTAVIAPRIASHEGRGCADTLASGEVNWPCNAWRSGGLSLNNDKLTSFDFVDEILRKLASKKAFPNLGRIVVTGHSAGGQFANRYSMGNTVHETLGIPVSYVVSNPSSYAYLDETRPNTAGSAFAPFGDAPNCPAYDGWAYGLQKRSGYTAKESDGQLRKQLAARPVVYLLGELDILPLAGFDSSCPAMAQGPTRLARGQAFATYVNEKFGAKHKAVVVPLCGHNARCMYTSETALPILFSNE
ncbi:MAG: alpha/beta fold hydrolase [Acidobacteriia bacterium]|nr:alpha/beta fold hydrolase [Terriglobia bacterium]